MRIPDPFTLIIFGGTGDLSHRKLFPALFKLYFQKRLATSFKIVGLGRRTYSDKVYREQIAESLSEEKQSDLEREKLTSFLEHIHFQPLDVSKK